MPRYLKLQPVATTEAQQAAASRPQQLPTFDGRFAPLAEYPPLSERITQQYAAAVLDLVGNTPFTTTERDKNLVSAVCFIVRWAVSLNGDFVPSRDLTEDALTRWARDYQDQNAVKLGTLGSYKSFARVVAKHNGLTPHDFGRASLPRSTATPPSPKDAWKKKLAAARNAPPRIRDDIIAVLDLTYGAGCRADEVGKAQANWLYWQPGGAIVRVVNRHGVVREVNLGPEAAERLRSLNRDPDEHLVRPGRTRHNLLSTVQEQAQRHCAPDFSFDAPAARNRYIVNLLSKPVPFRAVAYLADLTPGSHTPTDLLGYCETLTINEIHDLARRSW